ncbi:hypothetical protein AAG747_09575 [Rapidithrix thailandica]|uniref:Lipoprotein n=2 Tax=Rapidithrix thailandica TaxID=413964 RepID=A0AAW9RTS0_9BACT
MRKNLLLLIVLTKMLTSCGQEHKPTTRLDQKEFVMSNIPDTTVVKKSVNISNDKFIDTKYVYADSDGNEVTVVNSLPKGGLRYSAPSGIEYVYAVFWTRITNETDSPLELTMDFSEESYQLPSSPDRLFKLFIPTDTMTTDKETLFNYGLDLKKYLDNQYHKQTDFKRTITPKGVNGFYVIILFNKGVDGTIRTGLSLKGQKILYRVNDKEIECGYINLKQLK